MISHKAVSPGGEVPRILSEEMAEVKRDGSIVHRYILWVFQRPRLNKIAVAAAMEPSAITIDQNTPLERKPSGMASQ